MEYEKKVYLYAKQHPRAWLVFHDWIKNWMRWYRAGGDKEKKEMKFIIRKLVEKHWVEKGKEIYQAYNEALLDIWESWYYNKGETACIVLYLPIKKDGNSFL